MRASLGKLLAGEAVVLSHSRIPHPRTRSSFHFTVERVLWDSEARELVVLYLAELDERRMRACERMKLDADGRVTFAEALYGARAPAI